MYKCTQLGQMQCVGIALVLGGSFATLLNLDAGPENLRCHPLDIGVVPPPDNRQTLQLKGFVDQCYANPCDARPCHAKAMLCYAQQVEMILVVLQLQSGFALTLHCSISSHAGIAAASCF